MRRSALYLIIVAAGNLVWEAVQVPLYTIWSTGTTREIFVAVTHCTAGDVLIGTVTLLIGALVTRIRQWRPFGFRMMITTVVLGIAYTIFSEWLNVEVWNNWSYSAIMPVLPWFGTGLAPVLQWVIVPGLAFAISGMRKGDAAYAPPEWHLQNPNRAPSSYLVRTTVPLAGREAERIVFIRKPHSSNRHSPRNR